MDKKIAKTQRIKDRWLRSLGEHKNGRGDLQTIGTKRNVSLSPPLSNHSTSSGNPKILLHSMSLPLQEVTKSTSPNRITKAVSSPLVPSIDQKTLASLIVFNKKPAKRGSMKKALSAKSVQEYADTVEGQVIEKWSERTPEQLSVWVDFPRVVKHIQAFDERLNLIELPYTLKEDNDSTEEQEIRMRKNMREILILFAYRLGEKKEFLDIEKNFMTSLGVESNVHLKNFFETYISSTSKLMALVKVLNQSILASPYISLKKKFDAFDLPIVDVSGSWLIQTVFKGYEIVVIHSKRMKSTAEVAEEEFTFRWFLAISFDKLLTTINEVKLSINDLEMNKEIKEKTKKKLQSIKDHDLFI